MCMFKTLHSVLCGIYEKAKLLHIQLQWEAYIICWRITFNYFCYYHYHNLPFENFYSIPLQDGRRNLHYICSTPLSKTRLKYLIFFYLLQQDSAEGYTSWNINNMSRTHYFRCNQKTYKKISFSCCLEFSSFLMCQWKPLCCFDAQAADSCFRAYEKWNFIKIIFWTICFHHLSSFTASFLQESDMFMDALTASTKKEPRKRKRRTSSSKDGPEAKKEPLTGKEEDSNKDSTPPSSPTNANGESPPIVRPLLKVSNMAEWV